VVKVQKYFQIHSLLNPFCSVNISVFVTGKTDDKQAESPTPTLEPKSGKKRDRPERKSSHLSDGSSHSDSSSSPHFKRSGKLSFIKNMKPESVKRPSAVLNPEVAAQVATDTTACTLVGYRKTVCSSTFEPLLELGTLSPGTTFASSVDDSLFSSLPTLLAQGEKLRQSTGSLPTLTTEETKVESAESKDDVSESSSDMGDAIENGYLPSNGYSANSSDIEMASAAEKLDVEKVSEELSKAKIELEKGDGEQKEEDKTEDEKNEEVKEEGKKEVEEAQEEAEGSSGVDDATEAKAEAVEEEECAKDVAAEETKGKEGKEKSEKEAGPVSEKDIALEMVDEVSAKDEVKTEEAAQPQEVTSEGGTDEADKAASMAGASDAKAEQIKETKPHKTESAPVLPSLVGMGVLAGGDSFMPAPPPPAPVQEKEAAIKEADAKEETKFDDVDDNYLSGQCTILELLQEEYDKNSANKGSDSGISSSNRNSLMDATVGSESSDHSGPEDLRGATSSSSSRLNTQMDKAASAIRGSNSTPELSAMAKAKTAMLVSPVADKTIRYDTLDLVLFYTECL
jgi:hypothetical protein